MINDLLFVYGTLLDTHNEFGNYLRSNAKFYNSGKFKGRLYDVGEYPGAITGTKNDYNIIGDVYRLTSHDALKAIDDYEGYGDDQHQPNLFIRKLFPVETGGASADCWVYLYNFPVEGLVEIKSGDYKSYLKQK
ncbi:gamma-glutamylcyclotransferase [Mucilaginibacter sp. S1162]|uniref:Gamma-glutamylcyclotransferase n=1 Tax=Mucilaginibacter humi TaxID=2732510 RepID=A0ABX1W6I6_9SPHI|nr:gamma-glutamylcyclotransferase family protein [Mucilaginibacter humi]NNU34655.1 gamma-glutamylcyclotransferase [Mucilaginibacter humi]